MKRVARPRESGFSLVELLVAMVVTLIIAGGIFGFVAGGGSAFKREPELTDRQQNIRVAMQILQQDIARAGEHQGPFFQSLADGLDATGIVSPTGKTDALEVFFNDGKCPDAPANPGPCPGGNCATNGANINFTAPLPPCYASDSFVIVIYKSGRTKFGFGHMIHAGGEKLNFPPGLQPPASYIESVSGLGDYCADNPPGSGSPDCTPKDPPQAIGGVSVMRYEVANEADGTPSLWRSETGGFIPGGGYAPPPSTAAGWELIARGIEDFQVRYRNGQARNDGFGDGQGWGNGPGVVTCTPTCTDPVPKAAYDTMTQEVRVTLQARTTAATHLAGETIVANVAAGLGKSMAVRGQLTSSTTVRSTMIYLSQANPPIWQ